MSTRFEGFFSIVASALASIMSCLAVALPANGNVAWRKLAASSWRRIQ